MGEGGGVKREKGQFSKLLVSFILVLNIAFTTAILWLVWSDKPEPGILIGAWFGFTTGELWLLATIKKTKVKEECEHEEN